MIIVFPVDMLSPKRVDEHFILQCDADSAHGLGTALWDGFDLREVKAGGTVLYRGWIMDRDGYADLENAVRDRDAEMMTSAENYERGQYVNCWIDSFLDLTPHTFFLPADATS